MSQEHLHSLSRENERIQEVYARRQDGDRYSWFNPGHRLMMHDLETRILSLIEGQNFAPLESKKILEIGCGSGFWLREWIRWGARPENIVGLDVIPNRLAEAKELCPSGVSLFLRNAAETRLPDASFDLVMQSTLFTSILDADLRQMIAAEMLRVTKEDGLILWYDYFLDNPRNPDVRGVRKKEILAMFPNCRVTLKRVTLLPPLARALAPWATWACRLLQKIPLFCSHYLGVIRKI